MTEAPRPADAPIDPAHAARRALRRRLLAERDLFLASPAAAAATEALAAALREVVAELEPECLGLYCAFRSEFNAAAVIAVDPRFADLPLALPYARRLPKAMEFRRWDGATPTVPDECGIASCAGGVVVPDVVVVPCVGFTDAGHRSATAAATTTAGWRRTGRDRGRRRLVRCRVDLATFARGRTNPLALIVTERGRGLGPVNCCAGPGAAWPPVSTAARVAADSASTQAPNSITSERTRLAGENSIQ